MSAAEEFKKTIENFFPLIANKFLSLPTYPSLIFDIFFPLRVIVSHHYIKGGTNRLSVFLALSVHERPKSSSNV